MATGMKHLAPLDKKASHPTCVIGFDIETYSTKNLFCLGAFVKSSKPYFKQYNDKHECYTGMSNTTFNWKRHTHCYCATNLMFDFFGTVLPHSDNWSIVERRGKIYSITIKQANNKTIKLYDTLRYFNASVKQLGEILNLPKLQPPEWIGQRKPLNVSDYDELLTYCTTDALISALFMEKKVLAYCKEYDVPLRSTIGSLSMLTFRKHFLPCTITIESIDRHDIAFNSYYGGRTEVFRRGLYHNVSCYDFNSLYPSTMLYDLPDVRTGHTKKHVQHSDIQQYEGVCYIKGYLPYHYLPMMPVHNNKLLFPFGYIEGYYTFTELRYAMDYGLRIDHIGKGVVYKKKQPFLRDFAHTLYTRRLQEKEQKNPLEIMTKAILNNLYGKFAFNYRSTDTLLTPQQIKQNIDLIVKAKGVTPIGDWLHLSFDGETTPTSYSIPIWSSYITAYARQILHKAMVRTQDTLFYADTDSIFIPDTIDIQISKDLGGLKLEDGYPINKAVFVRPKFYYTHKAKIKGISKRPDFGEFITLLHERTWKQEKFCTLRSSLRRKNVDVNEIIPNNKEVSLDDSKRYWDSPFSLLPQTSQPFYRHDDNTYHPPHNFI